MADFTTLAYALFCPALGVMMAIVGCLAHSRMQRTRMETIQAYVAQGKEPPADLLASVSR